MGQELNKREAVRLLSQAMSNLRPDYPFKQETWRAFGFLDIISMAETGYKEVVVAPDKSGGIVTVEWEDKPFVRFDPTKVGSPSNHIGEIHYSYEQICQVFGRHDKWHDTYKQDASWYIEFQNGEKVSIGNYKDGHNYLGKKGKNLVDINRWDVWGTVEGFKLLKDTLKVSAEIDRLQRLAQKPTEES